MPTVMTMPSPSAMTCVQLTWSCPTVNPPLSVGNEIDGDWPPVVGHGEVDGAEEHEREA